MAASGITHSDPIATSEGAMNLAVSDDGKENGGLYGQNPLGEISIRGIDRRNFIKLIVSTGVVMSIGTKSWAAGVDQRNGIPYRTLGRTGEKVSIIGIGGSHIGKPNAEEAVAIVRTALDNGVNFLDNSWDYDEGECEIRMGKALKDGYRDKAFLMTKIDGRDKKTAEEQLNESLTRLGTDRLDLLQFHEVIRMDDADRIFAPGGALEAVVAAQKAGKVRYIGFTGHKSPEIHLQMLQVADNNGFQFDTVQMPLNVMDAHFQSFEKKVLPVLLEKNIGVLAMKTMGSNFILDSKVVTPYECLHYAMNLPVSVVITGCDSLPILQQALDAAQKFQRLSEQQVAGILAKTAPLAAEGKFERYKTSGFFDSTAKHPEYLGNAA
jgi:aryl-alcohol dehydrogenase-like predicted oxidoreductase